MEGTGNPNLAGNIRPKMPLRVVEQLFEILPTEFE